mmetsp:Transcript_54326/g.172544  ORF Transcript_54326/g.172544 Transcript_54326/m.172544 type:complete len:274 (-) Transcript_54326:180-1001(-)
MSTSSNSLSNTRASNTLCCSRVATSCPTGSISSRAWSRITASPRDTGSMVAISLASHLAFWLWKSATSVALGLRGGFFFSTRPIVERSSGALSAERVASTRTISERIWFSSSIAAPYTGAGGSLGVRMVAYSEWPPPVSSMRVGLRGSSVPGRELPCVRVGTERGPAPGCIEDISDAIPPVKASMRPVYARKRLLAKGIVPSSSTRRLMACVLCSTSDIPTRLGRRTFPSCVVCWRAGEGAFTLSSRVYPMSRDMSFAECNPRKPHSCSGFGA